jgi:hypothetical protein
MITKLTKEQEDRYKEFIDKWIAIGLSTNPADRKRAEKGIVGLYKLAGLESPKIEWELSPMAGVKKALSYGSDLGGAFFGGSLWAGYSARADFFNEVCGVKIDRNFLEMVESCGYYWTFDKVAILTERPCKISRNERGQLHCTDGMAIQYPDGWGLYALNGVVVDEAIVMTPASKLDVKLAVETQNVEVRREIVRKIGIDIVEQKLGSKILDSKPEMNYELISINFGDKTDRPYLKMKNPSIGVYHIEGVPPGVKTVDEALQSRKPEWMRAIPIDDINGMEYYQQGDVLIVPRGAKSLKRYPSKLT